MEITEYNLDITNNDKRYHRILIDLYNSNINNKVAKCYKKMKLYPSINDFKNKYMIINHFINDDIISNFSSDNVNILYINNGIAQLNEDIYIYGKKNEYISLFIFFIMDIDIYFDIKYDVYILKNGYPSI